MILNSPYITGSITVTGNANIQGQLTVTGSLSGTAATASFALTLGGTGSVGFATTGAFTATSGSASSRLTQIEQVYATTGSNSFRATQSITGSLTVTGQIIAQTLNVQQVTSSIVYSSGSNVFGCDINSRQTFTGSFYQTGSTATFSGRICSNSTTTSNLRLSDETTFGLTMCKGPSVYPIIIADGAQSIGFYTCESGGAFGERLKIWQTGAVTIGCQVCIGAGTDTPINSNKGLYITHNGTTALTIRDSTNDSEFTAQAQNSGTIIGTLTNHDLIVYSCNTERMRIANNGIAAFCTTNAVIMAKGTVAQRPTAVSGMLRYNNDYNLMEFYNGSCWVQMGSGDLATGFCFNNLSMCHDVYRAAGTLGLQGQGSACITLYGAAAPSMPTSNVCYQFATHGGHCGVSDYPGYWGVNLAAAKAVNQLKVWIHANSWGYFELQGSNNSGNASGFATNGTWTSLSFLCSNNSNCQNMGGNASGCADGTVFIFWYTNDVPFQAYRIKVLDSSRQTQALGTTYAGSAGYIWQLNRV